ncbi:MAG TPA: DUF2079 domain-containing protein [Acidimicrobiales bacterium]|nr:DUF2079 domain-containing protein [Acidimicrobiales bacterium]
MTTAAATTRSRARRLDWRTLSGPPTTPRLLLGGVMALYASFYIVHLTLYHDRFWTTDYDLGIFDQSAWLLAHGRGFITIRGLSFWGHHVNPAMLVFVPFYWLGAGPRFLNAAMVVSLTCGAIAVFRITVHYVKSEWIGLALSIAFLLHTSSQYVLHETFHPEVLAVAPMLFAYLAAVEGRWGAFRNWLVFAVLWKEDIAITAAMFGLVLFFRGHRKQGATAFVLSVAYYFFATRVVLSAFSPGDGAFYSNFLGDLGNSPQALLDTAVTNPTMITRQLDRANAVGYFRDLAEPYAFLPFLAPIGILIALPQTILNLLTIHAYSWSIRWHYASMPLFGFTVSLAESMRVVRWIVRRLRQWFIPETLHVVAAAMLVCAMWTSYAWSPSYGAHYQQNWPLFADPRRVLLNEAIALVPGGAPTAASYNLVPHIAHRAQIFTFPNPWMNSYWGLDAKDANGNPTVLPKPRSPAIIQWVAVDATVLSPQAKAILSELRASPQWEVHLDRADVVVLSRRTLG